MAREPLGCILVSRLGGALTAGRIVETEAYLGPEDGASHAAFRPSSRWLFYGPGGIAYVFLAYGLHACLNAIAGPAGTPGCVLIRALEPLDGDRAMARRRRQPLPREPVSAGARRADERPGSAHPGARNHASATTAGTSGRARSASTRRPAPDASRSSTSRRIGISRSPELPLRFSLADNPFVSRPRP